MLILHAVGEERQRQHVDRSIDEERVCAEDLPEWAGECRPRNEETTKGGDLKEGYQAATQLLVMTGARRNIREDRRDARGGGCPLKEARGDQERDGECEGGDEYGDEPEERPEQHDGLPADVIRHDPEDRRACEFGDIEGERDRRHVGGRDGDRAAIPKEGGPEDEEGARGARGRPQDQGPEEERAHRTSHPLHDSGSVYSPHAEQCCPELSL